MSDKKEQTTLGLPDDAPLDSVEQYRFEREPIKGQPELRWTGKRPFTGTQYYPAQLRETYGQPVDGWLNRIYWGDNLQVMSHLLKEFRGKVQLVYIDPPFDSKIEYKKTIMLHGKEAINDYSNFEEKQYTDIWTNDDYLQFMFERLILIRELLTNAGSVFVHCDWRVNHYLKLIMDDIFGIGNFRNDIRWRRQPPRGAKAISKQFARSSDSILFYSKTDQRVWKAQYKPYSDKYINAKFTNRDENGRVYRIDAIGDYSKDSIENFRKEGKIYDYPSGKIGLIRYLDEANGEAISDIWVDINEVNSQAKDRQDYPTQKPEALLERIIKASSSPGDLVLDCFMGSGTTQAVAMKLGRRFLGADINLGAVEITSRRLISVAAELNNAQRQQKLDAEWQNEDGETRPIQYYTGFSVYNVNHYDVFRNPVEARGLLLEALEIQPYPPGHVFDGEKDGQQVKLMPVNRIATRADLNDLIANLDYKTLERRHADAPNQPTERILLVCMGHEPDLAAQLQQQVPFKLAIRVYDVLRDGQHLTFKRPAEAHLTLDHGELVIDRFYPMNLLQKLSLLEESVDDWRQLVETVKVDWQHNGQVFAPALIDAAEGETLVKGRYPVPPDAARIKVKITDLLSESWEGEINAGG